MVQGVAVVDGNIICVNPATGKEVSKVPVSTPEDIEATITAAAAAQQAWAARPLADRIAALKDAVAELDKIKDELIPLITEEMGKPRSEAEEEVGGAVSKDVLLGHVADANKDVQHGSCTVRRVPHGVV
eukprot:gene10294-9089_t